MGVNVGPPEILKGAKYPIPQASGPCLVFCIDQPVFWLRGRSVKSTLIMQTLQVSRISRETHAFCRHVNFGPELRGTLARYATRAGRRRWRGGKGVGVGGGFPHPRGSFDKSSGSVFVKTKRGGKNFPCRTPPYQRCLQTLTLSLTKFMTKEHALALKLFVKKHILEMARPQYS